MKQYRIVERRDGPNVAPFYQVESREKGWFFWGDWSSFGETYDVCGFGASALRGCKLFIADKESPKPAEYFYSGRVVQTEQGNSCHSGTGDNIEDRIPSSWGKP